ncbi:MAG TPA: NADH-quinone oxidoreductase subunit C, partial [Kineosporiaceae bacterium]
MTSGTTAPTPRRVVVHHPTQPEAGAVTAGAVTAPPGAGLPYRARVVGLLATGHRFAGLSVAPGGAAVRAQFARPGGPVEVVTADVDGGSVASIVDLVPAAAWDEREAHDRYGVGFAGHEPLRALVDHGELDTWTTPVRGEDTYQVAVGPIHAGVIESGHFRFHLVGDRILHLDARLFYKHRGLERAAEGGPLSWGLAHVERACAGCAVANAVAYVQAAEEVLGLVPGAGTSRARTVLLELERVWNHLNDIAAICAGVGLAAGNTRFSALTDRARRLNAVLTGHRFLFGTVQVGASALAVSADRVRVVRADLAELRREAEVSWRELIFNTSLTARLPGIGVVAADDAERLGTVGPAGR